MDIISPLAIIVSLLTWGWTQVRCDKMAEKVNMNLSVKNQDKILILGDKVEQLMLEINVLKSQHNKMRDEVDPFMETDLSKFDLTSGLFDFNDEE